MRKKRVHILATGGTIAGIGQEGATEGYASGVIPIAELIERQPRLHRLADITYAQVANLNSDDITQQIWLDLARRVEALAETADGFVITHGTDTLEETAYFLHLALCVDKPVILTGAMRPATAESPDGPLNLHQAVALAAHPEAGGKGVLVAFNEGIYGARDVCKAHTFRTHAVTGGDFGCVGLMRGDTPLFYYAPMRPHTGNTVFRTGALRSLPKVAVAYFHIDADPRLLDMLADTHDGLIIAGAGDGVVSIAWAERLHALCKQGLPVVRATRVSDGAVLRNAGMNDDALGTIAADTLSPEKARVLLMLALTVTHDAESIQRMFETY